MTGQGERKTVEGETGEGEGKETERETGEGERWGGGEGRVRGREGGEIWVENTKTLGCSLFLLLCYHA